MTLFPNGGGGWGWGVILPFLRVIPKCKLQVLSLHKTVQSEAQSSNYKWFFIDIIFVFVLNTLPQPLPYFVGCDTVRDFVCIFETQ